MPTSRAFLLSLLIILTLWWAGQTYLPSPPHSEVATSTVIVLPPEPRAPPTTVEEAPSPALVASMSPVSSREPAVAKKTIPVAPPSIVPVVLPTQDQVQNALETTATKLRAALVNIICSTSSSGLHSVSGSGVVIDPKGYILTNAHIAQYFLLADRVTCRVRAGDPATDRYTASLVYFPSAWLKANATLLTNPAPMGTGEYDFAILGVTGSIASAPIPAALPLATLPLVTGAPVAIGSYGAELISSNQIQSNLFSTLVYGSVKGLATFHTNSIDVLALGGSVAAQEGSSGGGVANASGELSALITTSTLESETRLRDLNAITASYIRGEYANETGEALDTLLAEPVAASIASFAPTAATLGDTLRAVLP